MKRSDKLLLIFSKAEKAGGGIQTTAELTVMMREPRNGSFIKFLSDCAQKGLIRRVVRGIYESVLTPPDPQTAIYKIVKKMRSNAISYISLESQLSHVGEISQIPIDRLTVVTKGRSGTYKTPYGVIEFTHTKQPINRFEHNLYFDPDIKMYRANTEQALADLKHTRRNLHLLDP